MAGAIVAIVVVVFLLIAFARTVRIIPQARAGVVERFGRYSRTLTPGLAILVPFMDRLKPLIDLREQVVSFPPQPVITEDNVVVQIDTVLYFTVTDAKGATYEIANPLQGIEQITVTTLRNVVGGMMSFSSTRLTRTPHFSVTSSRTARILELISSRLVSVLSRVRPPMTFRRVVCVSCSMAATRLAISYVALFGSTIWK